MLRIQTIVVKLKLKEGQEPYKFIEHGKYNALKHFFTDINYRVTKLESRGLVTALTK